MMRFSCGFANTKAVQKRRLPAGVPAGCYVYWKRCTSKREIGAQFRRRSRMFQFEWRDEYCVDGGAIDEQHKSLFSLANRIFAIDEPGRRVAEIKATVKALFRHMERHFQHEENFMQEVGFPDRLAHHRRHTEMAAEMNAELRRHTDINEYVAALRTVMLDWVVRHVIDEDGKLAAYAGESLIRPA
jgi:hemerythrin